MGFNVNFVLERLICAHFLLGWRIYKTSVNFSRVQNTLLNQILRKPNPNPNPKPLPMDDGVVRWGASGPLGEGQDVEGLDHLE